MPERRVMVSLATTATEPVRAEGVFNEFTTVERIRRSGIVMVVAVLLAATLIPIPIVHLLGIPLLLVGGAILSIRQLSMVGRLHPLRIACPKCGELNRVGGGLGYSSDAPRERMCDSCRRGLTLSIDPESGFPVTQSPAHTS
jgi:hypothetical protein